MALLTTQTVKDGPLFADVDMGSDYNAPTLRATVVQVSAIFHDTPATLDKAERLLAEAGSYGSQRVVFPEAFVSGDPRGSNFGNYHPAAIDVAGKTRAKFDFDVVGRYSRPPLLNLIVRDHPTTPVTFTSTSTKIEGSQK